MLGVMSFVFPLLVLAAMVVAIVDIVTRDDSQIKHMPKFVWLILVILLPLLGVILWFTIGREYPEHVSRAPRAPRPSRRVPPAPPSVPSGPYDPRTTEQQLADLEREIEEDRLRAELRRRQQGGAQEPPQDPSGPSAP
jgi:hypothetical protein